MSSVASTRLDDSWLDDSDLDNSLNADTNRDSEPDTNSDSVIAGELEGNRRDCNTMEKQRGGRQ